MNEGRSGAEADRLLEMLQNYPPANAPPANSYRGAPPENLLRHGGKRLFDGAEERIKVKRLLNKCVSLQPRCFFP
jgi:hypothetical protein